MFHAFLQVDQHRGDHPHETLEPGLRVVVPGDYVLAVLLVPFVRADPKRVADLAADILVERTAFPVRFGQRQPAQASVGNPHARVFQTVVGRLVNSGDRPRRHGSNLDFSSYKTRVRLESGKIEELVLTETTV